VLTFFWRGLVVAFLLLTFFYLIRPNYQELERKTTIWLNPLYLEKLKKSDGSKITSIDLGKGSKLLHFWAPWCVPCQQELPKLFDFFKKNNISLAKLVLVAINAGQSKVKDFLPPNGTSFFGHLQDLKYYFDSDSIPQSFLFDREGKLLWHGKGPQNWDSLKMGPVLKILSEAGHEQ